MRAGKNVTCALKLCRNQRDLAILMSIAIVDYGAGNIGSVLNMLKKIGVSARRAATPEAIASAERLILPGVGAFDHCMGSFEASGLKQALEDVAFQAKKPVLGICVGMQMMLEGSAEGQRPGLGWIKGRVVRFALNDPSLKIPHMGWSDVTPAIPHPLFDGFDGDARFYFVHSYHPACADKGNVMARADYGMPFECAITNGNIAGVQFHPEKSHRYGMRLLKNFSTWTPQA